MAQTIKKLTDLWKNVLQNSKIDWNKLYMQWQLERKDYVELMKVLELLGWKWSRWEKCHIFDCENLQEAIDEVCETMEVVDIKTLYQQFYTPSALATRLVELAEIKETDTVLEPSAWQGAIVDEILKTNYKRIVLKEIDVKNIKTLKEKYNVYEWMKDTCDDQWTFSSEKRMNIYQWDFLNSDFNNVDKIVANPPFRNSQDVKHILKMYSTLEKWWRLVSLASSSIQTRSGKLYDELRDLNPEYIEVESWAFKDMWTMVNTVIVILNK